MEDSVGKIGNREREKKGKVYKGETLKNPTATGLYNTTQFGLGFTDTHRGIPVCTSKALRDLFLSLIMYIPFTFISYRRYFEGRWMCENAASKSNIHQYIYIRAE